MYGPTQKNQTILSKIEAFRAFFVGGVKLPFLVRKKDFGWIFEPIFNQMWKSDNLDALSKNALNGSILLKLAQIFLCKFLYN